MNAQEQFWQGDFGNEYTGRNRVDWRARLQFWKQMIDHTGARSVYEVGCNAGWNLSAIRRVFPDVELYGHDLNALAWRQAVLAGLNNARCESEPLKARNAYDLVFTAGVLIHIAPDQLPQMMESIAAASAQFVLAVEYDSDEEQEIEYRGHEQRLWKRPFGKVYEQLGLRCVESGDAQGFDRCTFWLMEKP